MAQSTGVGWATGTIMGPNCHYRMVADMKSHRIKTGRVPGSWSKGRGRLIAKAAGSLATINVWSRLNEDPSFKKQHAESARCRTLGQDTLDMYRSLYEPRYQSRYEDIS
jgi:hypothetical protein